MEAGGRFTPAAPHGTVCAAMNELRELRRSIRLGQREFAALLSIPLETYRPWDSDRRVVSAAILQRAREAVVHHQRQHELLPLDQLARELHVHLRTLQAAARTGRLDAHFSVRSAFGRPIRHASRAAADRGNRGSGRRHRYPGRASRLCAENMKPIARKTHRPCQRRRADDSSPTARRGMPLTD
jgi:transcriptional regulator with XRE-family HTH domain